MISLIVLYNLKSLTLFSFKKKLVGLAVTVVILLGFAEFESLSYIIGWCLGGFLIVANKNQFRLVFACKNKFLLIFEVFDSISFSCLLGF